MENQKEIAVSRKQTIEAIVVGDAPQLANALMLEKRHQKIANQQ